MKDFTVCSKEMGDVSVLYPEGYLNNIAAERLEKECAACLKKGTRKIVLNFSKVEFINSIGVSILLGIIEMMKVSGATFCLSDLREVHDETFAMLGLKKHMRVFSTEDKALSTLGTKGKA